MSEDGFFHGAGEELVVRIESGVGIGTLPDHLPGWLIDSALAGPSELRESGGLSLRNHVFFRGRLQQCCFIGHEAEVYIRIYSVDEFGVLAAVLEVVDKSPDINLVVPLFEKFSLPLDDVDPVTTEDFGDIVQGGVVAGERMNHPFFLKLLHEVVRSILVDPFVSAARHPVVHERLEAGVE